MSHNFKEVILGHFENNEFVFFWAGPFSNWHKCNFIMDIDGEDVGFSSSEQAMMYLKALLFNDYDIARIMLKQHDPRKVKQLGRKVKNFDENIWIKYREKISDEFLYAKFSQNEKLKKILLDTGNKIICEASPYDSVWGIKMGVDHPDILDMDKWSGLNLLGKSLMRIRDKLI